jgi:hypothetical protein
VRAGGNRVAGERLALARRDDDLRMQILLVLDDDHGLLAGGFVDLLLHRHALDDVVELHRARLLGENRHVVRIPLHEGLALLHLAPSATEMTAPMTTLWFRARAVLAEDRDGTVLVQHDVVAVLELHEAQSL